MRKVLFSAIAATMLASCATSAPRSHEIGHWSQFRLNSQNNVVLPGTLETAWSVESGGAISASPSVVDGRLFVGNNVGRFLALDIRNGREVWQAGFDSALMSAPIVIGNNVIVGEGDESTMVMHGVVHVGTGVNALISLDRASGAVRWNVPLEGTAMPTSAYVDGRLVAHIGTGDLVSLSPETGKVAFHHNVGTIPSMVALLPLGGDTIVTAGQTETAVVAVHASSGAQIWRQPFPNSSALGDCPLASDGVRVMGDYLFPLPGHPYVKAGRIEESRAYALDAKTGNRLWDVHLENGLVPIRNQAAIPLVDRGALYLGSAIVPIMHAIDIKTGHVRWRHRVDGPVKGGVVAINGNIYFGDATGRIWALRESDGTTVGVMNVGTPFNVASPIVIGKTLVLSSLTGRILALPLSSMDGARDVVASQKRASSWFAPDVLTRFRASDTNHDGVLDRTEFRRALGFANFSRVDRDRNGTVSPFEFGMAVADADVQFSRLDGRSEDLSRR